MIVITRSIRQSIKTAGTLSRIGLCDLLIEPVLNLRVSSLNFPKIDGGTVLVITSANALENHGVICYRNSKILTIGCTIAPLARDLGFCDIESVGGDVDELIKYIASNFSKSCRFFYLRGRHITRDIKSRLELLGFVVSQLTVYTMDRSEYLSENFLQFSFCGRIDMVLLYSDRSAEAFLRLLERYGLINFFKDVEFCALSAKIAKILPFENVYVAKSPTSSSMIDLVLELKLR